jgi:hypothetical protein
LVENEIHATLLAPRHRRAVGPHVVFLFQAFQRLVVRPLDRNAMVARERLDPLLVLVRARAQGLFRNRVDAVDVPKEMDDVRLARQQRQVALNDDAIETVVYKREQAAEQLAEGFHRSSPASALASTTRSLDRGPVEIQRFAAP